MVFQVGQVVEVLRGCTHQAFPVTPDVDKAFESAEPFDLHGMVPYKHQPRSLPQSACMSIVNAYQVLKVLCQSVGFFKDPALSPAFCQTDSL